MNFHSDEKRGRRSARALAAVVTAAAICVLAAMPVSAAQAKASATMVVKGKTDRMTINRNSKEISITATVVKDCSQPSVCDWGRRFQAFFGAKGGKMEPFFIFTTDVSRADIDKAIRGLGIKSRRQIPMAEVAKRTGLKSTTVKDDYLDGDPLIVVIRYTKGNQVVESALEDLIEEKIAVDGKEVIKPYTPHFVYHGTAEAIAFASGCIVCPSGCNGGIIADNALPLKTTTNYFRFNWDKMPPAGSKVEVVLKSVYGGAGR
ncbi:hypothetical protein BURK2_03699 [Burkholderiales bacterium]|nr:hypothetical protein BURK2_03699 [Burkholderiales bacterium]